MLSHVSFHVQVRAILMVMIPEVSVATRKKSKARDFFKE
jgi:hypothetical protein